MEIDTKIEEVDLEEKIDERGAMMITEDSTTREALLLLVDALVSLLTQIRLGETCVLSVDRTEATMK